MAFAPTIAPLQQRVRDYSPERVAGWTGIPASDIEKLAREYSATRPAAIRVNYGVQRAQNGGMAVRTIAMLPCLTGSWKEVGGRAAAFPQRVLSAQQAGA